MIYFTKKQVVHCICSIFVMVSLNSNAQVSLIQKLIDKIDNYKNFSYLSINNPSVGRIFKGHSGIRQYFEDYFIGYQTKTRLIKLNIIADNAAHIEVEFTGKFPEGKIKGVFDFTFKGGKIASAKAGLI